MSVLASLSEPTKHGLDYLSIGTIAVTIWANLPQIGAALSVIWLLLRIATGILDHRIKQQEYKLNERKLRE